MNGGEIGAKKWEKLLRRKEGRDDTRGLHAYAPNLGRIPDASHVHVDRCHRYSSRHAVISTRLAICDINRLEACATAGYPSPTASHCPIKPDPSFQSYYSFNESLLDSDRLRPGKLNFSRGQILITITYRSSLLEIEICQNLLNVEVRSYFTKRLQNFKFLEYFFFFFVIKRKLYGT